MPISRPPLVRRSVSHIYRAVVGTIIGAGVVALFPGDAEQAAILTGLRLSGVEWMWLVLTHHFILNRLSATRYAANRVLKGLT